MTTSGTIATTSIDTATAIEHAFRRCKVHPSKQTPETVSIAKNNLYLLLTHMTALGVNLWATQKYYVGCVAGQQTYTCPTGTIDLLNFNYSRPTRETGTDSSTATTYTTQLSAATTIIRVGIKLSAATAADTLSIQHSTDGVSYTTAESFTKADWTTDTWYWFDLDPSIEDVYFKARFTSAATFSEFYLASEVVDSIISPWSRDTWFSQTTKVRQSGLVTNYWFEKLLTPQVNLWPAPDNSYDHLTMFVHRQVQDVGTLTQTLEIPARWYETIIWQLALRLAFELPSTLVPIEVTAQVREMADKYTFEASLEESDGMPLFVSPMIGAYTR